MILFDREMLDALVLKAKQSPRLRANLNVHAELSDPVQRLFIAIEPGSYVRPHRHMEAEKWELFVLVRGRIAILIFDQCGKVLRRDELLAGGENMGFEIPANTWHCVVALESGSIFFEVKRGPYVQPRDKDFALWAPQEGELACSGFFQWMVNAQAGDTAPTI